MTFAHVLAPTDFADPNELRAAGWSLPATGWPEVFGADPKRELHEDVLQFKSLIEQGRATGGSGTVTCQVTITAVSHIDQQRTRAKKASTHPLR